MEDGDDAQVDVPEHPILHVSNISISDWPMPIHARSGPRSTPEPQATRSPPRCRNYFARSHRPRTSTSLPHAPLESALATIADQNNRHSSVQAQLLMLGAGAAAEAKLRNRELVSRNQQLVQQKEKLEHENAAVRELKNRAVLLSQENARLVNHANEAAGLRQRNGELEAELATLHSDAAMREEAQTRNAELSARCAELQETVKQLRDANTALQSSAAAEGIRHRELETKLRDEARTAAADEVEKAATVARAEHAGQAATLKAQLEAAQASQEAAVATTRGELAAKLMLAEKEVADAVQANRTDCTSRRIPHGQHILPHRPRRGAPSPLLTSCGRACSCLHRWRL